MHLGSDAAIGVTLWESTQIITRAFDRVLAEHGGNRPVWFILMTLDRGVHTTQRALAQAVGITDATLTHHLNALERRGLIARHRDADDRRVQRIELTDDGETAFRAMRTAAIDFDRRMREVVGPDDLEALRRALGRLVEFAQQGDAPARRPAD